MTMRPIFKKKNKGFVLLFAVSLAALLMAIAVGVSGVASKEVRFGTSAESTAGAFFAADAGVECAIFHDRSSRSVFPVEGQETTISCNNQNTVTNYVPTAYGGIYDFIVGGLGSGGTGCAKVTVEKDDNTDPTTIETRIVSKGYNTGDASCGGSSARVERELEVRYYDANTLP